MDMPNNENSLKLLSANIENIASQVGDLRLPEKAYHIIRIAIKNLILKPGKTFLEREIAEILEMSRTPVREGLIRLQADDMITLIPRKGFKVNPILEKDIKEIYEITESLDGLAIEMATEKATDHALHELSDIVMEQKKYLAQDDLYEWSKQDDEFHEKITQLADNSKLINMRNIHADQLYRVRLYTINARPIPEFSIEEHEAMLACMKIRDGKAARQLMESHRKRAWQEIREALK
ncbi:GntR family transcriptional regulator [Staphylococcus arlettae]|uniref:GntR family transcriptional regulator n=1 Tax=Staphylococcus TaxID=1279 RepID=UPI001E470EEF|nr:MULTISPECIES: GntR family transcriptional regulator [Staphylococcus]MEB6066357.1 GntR family transcriptional regulator [Staphylococcus arlettae]MEB7421497.1 GntR family transcriptional regulator [Staphylococcus arlettae]URN39330.1 GntR family transcriptional regulator [Staphylococcus arlettae]